MNKLLMILNPHAGQKKANKHLHTILRTFCEYGYRCEVYVTGAPGDATRYVMACGEDYDLIVCAGGDGTLNETIAGIVGAGLDCPVGYIPCGTTNDYASSIGLSGDVAQAALDIMQGKPRDFDVGRFNGRYFVYTATCGAFARASYSTSQAAKNVLGHLAYVLEGVRDISSLKPFHMHVETEDAVLDDQFIFCSITNSTSVGGILKLDSRLVSLNDGKFEITLVREPKTPADWGKIISGVTSQNLPNDMIAFMSARDIRVTAEKPMEWTLDGERGEEIAEAVMENVRNAVRIIIPQIDEATPPPLAGETT